MGLAGPASAGDDPMKVWLRSNVPHVARELFAGGAAGAIAKTCVAPLERTKILLMTGRSKVGAFGTLRLIAATEGARGFFRGNGASCLRIVPYAAIHFSVYEAYRRILAGHLLPPLPSSSVGGVGAAGGDDITSSSNGGRLPSLLTLQHLGNEVPPTPMSSSIEVSATAVITAAEEEQREAPPPSPPLYRPMEDLSAQRWRLRPGPVVDLVAGSAAGATAVLLTYPLDMVRTRMAWALDGTSRRPAAAAAAAAATMATWSPPENRAGAGAVPATQLSPATTAMTSGLRTNTTAAQIAREPAPPFAHHTRIGAMLVHTARSEGVRGLYRGLAPTLYGIMPYAGLKFFVYGSLKQWYREARQPPHPLAQWSSAAASPGAGKGGGGGGERLPVPYMLAFGGVSGLLAQTVTYPLDVIRRRMQVYSIQLEAACPATAATAGTAHDGVLGRGSASMAPTPRCGGGTPPSTPLPAQRAQLTTWGVGSTIVRQEGLRGLFRGLSLNYVKVVPSTAIGFTVYDILKSYLGVLGNQT